MTMAETIRARRRALGLTQQQVADALGVTHGAVAQWEGRGTPNSPHRDRLRDLAALLEIDVETLLGQPQRRPQSLLITDDRERSLIGAWRRLSRHQQETHLALFQVSAGLAEPVQRSADPEQGFRRRA